MPEYGTYRQYKTVKTYTVDSPKVHDSLLEKEIELCIRVVLSQSHLSYRYKPVFFLKTEGAVKITETIKKNAYGYYSVFTGYKKLRPAPNQLPHSPSVRKNRQNRKRL